MSVQPIPAGYETFIPHLICDPCSEALEFYKKAFGAVEFGRMPGPDGKKVMHAEIKIDGKPIFLVDDFPEFANGKSNSPKALRGTTVTIHRYVLDVDAAVQQAVDAGATILMPPSDMFWGDRYGIVTDPFGHQWSFATHLRDMKPEEMMAAMAESCAGQPQ